MEKILLKICEWEFVMNYYNTLVNPNYSISPNSLTYLIYWLNEN